MTKNQNYFGLTKTAWESLCKRCGKCCMVAKNIPCKYLVYSSDGKATCTIYKKKTRFDTDLGLDRECGELKDADFLPLGCAYRNFFPLKPTELE
jgi:uncharacterized cysteine cluster protein YcgN (CxxCxxCC family)